MSKTKQYKAVYQGVPGSYTEMALRQCADHYKINLTPVEERGFFDGVYERIDNETGLGFVPFANSQAGTVYQNVDLFLKHKVEILSEWYLPVNHCLAVHPSTKKKDIQLVVSHYQALAQCTDYLHKHGYETDVFHDTAAAAELVSESDEPMAAICSERAAELYGLKIIDRKIQNIADNATRFLLIKKQGKRFDFEKKLFQKAEQWKTGVLFTTKDIPAALYKCLGGFATNGVNLTKLESRPSRDKKFDYFFYLDCEGRQGDAPVDRALEELQHFSKEVRIMGSYVQQDMHASN